MSRLPTTRVTRFKNTRFYRALRLTLPFRLARYWRNYLLPPGFNAVYIETTTACNRKCYYCPHSTVDRQPRLMDEDIFRIVIEALKRYPYEGIVVLNGFGEPLTDTRIVRLTRYAKQQLPSSTLLMHTNGDFLSVDTYLDLKNAGLDFLVVSQHEENLSKSLTDVLEYLKEHHRDKYSLAIVDTFHSDGKMNVGGLVNIESAVMAECRWPGALTIDCNGNVILCCNDYNSSIVFGNAAKEDILKIWFKKPFVNARSKIFSGFWPYVMCARCAGVAAK